MTTKKTILVTGVTGYWGAKVASELIARTQGDAGNNDTKLNTVSNYHVLGVDSEPLVNDISDLDFIQVDVRNPLFVELLKAENVHTVCHLDFTYDYYRSEKLFDRNVLGTMKLVGACLDAGVKKVIIKSSTFAYGAHPTNPAFLTEKHELRGSKKFGYTRDFFEIASFCVGYCHENREMALTALRFSNIVGPTVDSPMTRYLSLPVLPVLMGFDPMMQIIHEDDVLDALLLVIEQDFPGVYNVAADDVFPLRRLIGLAGKMPMPVFHPFAYLASDVIKSAKMSLGKMAPIEWDYLRYSWVVDTSLMKSKLNFSPKYTAEETLRQYKQYNEMRQYEKKKTDFGLDEQYMRDIIELRSQGKDR